MTDLNLVWVYKREFTLAFQGYKKSSKGKLTVFDKIDKIVTNRWLVLPVFAVVAFIYLLLRPYKESGILRRFLWEQ